MPFAFSVLRRFINNLQCLCPITREKPYDPVWLYYRVNFSHCDVEDLLAERGVTVTYESIRLWCIKFGAKYAWRIKRKHQGYGNTFYLAVR